MQFSSSKSLYKVHWPFKPLNGPLWLASSHRSGSQSGVWDELLGTSVKMAAYNMALKPTHVGKQLCLVA